MEPSLTYLAKVACGAFAEVPPLPADKGVTLSACRIGRVKPP
jgi:hypothetical protein